MAADPSAASEPYAPSATLGDVVAELKALRDLMASAVTPPTELVDRTALAGLLGVSVATLDRLRAAGSIGPRSVELSGPKWLRAEVSVWLTHRDHRGELLDLRTWSATWERMKATHSR